MKKHINEIISDVCLLLGVYPGEITSGEETPYPSLHERIRREIVSVAREVIPTLPKKELTGWRLLPGEDRQEHSADTTTLTLPEDFLMLYCLRLSGWEREVTEILTPEDPAVKMGRTRWKGLQPTDARPAAILHPGEEGGKRLELRPGGESRRLTDGWYLPAPEIDAAGEIEIPAAAYHQIADTICRRVRTSDL